MNLAMFCCAVVFWLNWPKQDMNVSTFNRIEHKATQGRRIYGPVVVKKYILLRREERADSWFDKNEPIKESEERVKIGQT